MGCVDGHAGNVHRWIVLPRGPGQRPRQRPRRLDQGAGPGAELVIQPAGRVCAAAQAIGDGASGRDVRNPILERIWVSGAIQQRVNGVFETVVARDQRIGDYNRMSVSAHCHRHRCRSSSICLEICNYWFLPLPGAGNSQPYFFTYCQHGHGVF